MVKKLAYHVFKDKLTFGLSPPDKNTRDVHLYT